MLSKDEILKKKGKSPEQLDLVKDLDENKSKKRSRLFLILILVLTIGSSTGLWVYRLYQEGQLNLSFNLSLPKLPQISTPIVTDKNVWQVCFYNAISGKLIHNQNCQLTQMSNSKIKNNIELIKSTLPNGLLITEQISTSSSEINYTSSIYSPKFEYLLNIKIFGSYPLDISQSLIPKMVSDLYWRYSQR